MRRQVVFAAACLCALSLTGCARFPETGAAGRTKRLILSMSMEGAVRTGLEAGGAGLPYVYIFAIKLNTDAAPTTPGPQPIVTPGGNGFVAGGATHYILWDPLRSPQYTIWQFRDASLSESFQVGIPLSYTTISPGAKTLSCEIDLSQLVPSGDVGLYQSAQINFLTMNNTLTSGGGRLWDALGDSRSALEVNRPQLVDLRRAVTYNNTNEGLIEPTGDTADPDLDLRDWSIEVRPS